MSKIIAYVGPGFSEVESQKIAETLRIRQIETTNVKEKATLVICVQKDVPGFGMTLEKVAETIIENYYQEIMKLKAQLQIPDIIIPDVPKHTQNKHPHSAVQRTIKQYNQTKQKLFNRTQCK
ncbi:MAG: hypothetical protein J5620_03975 [Alphaproteobacteria bacterium]|nr:hypothetical protein [Alphaproteobacteria bacterium]